MNSAVSVVGYKIARSLVESRASFFMTLSPQVGIHISTEYVSSVTTGLQLPAKFNCKVISRQAGVSMNTECPAFPGITDCTVTKGRTMDESRIGMDLEGSGPGVIKISQNILGGTEEDPRNQVE
jgi:hypothetical protein